MLLMEEIITLMDKFYWKAVWLMVGFFFAVAGSMMLISGSFQLNSFYDVGKVYDVDQNSLMTSWNDTIYYDNMEQVLVLNSETAVKNFILQDVEGGWNYIYISLSDISGGSVDARLDFYDVNDALTAQMNVSLKEGDNLIKSPTELFYRLDFVMENQKDLTFHIDQLQFRENVPVFSMKKFVGYLMLLWTGFLLVTGILYRNCEGTEQLRFKKKIGNISWYAPVLGLQKIFMYVGEHGERFDRKYSQKQRGWIRSGLFCFIFLLMQISFILRFYSNKGFRYLALICVAALVLIALSCWEKQLHCLNWNNKLVLSWLGLWVISMISDIVVAKRCAYMGYVMIFIIGFLFFMWENMEHRELLIRDFIRGIQWSFIPNIIFCWLFRPYIPGYRYMGATYSPGIFGLYVLFVWLAFFAEIKFDDRDKDNLKKDIIKVVMLGICASFLWKTQSISSLLPAALIALVFSLKLWINRRKLKYYSIPVLMLVFIMGFLVNNHAIYRIPRALNTEVKFEKDFYMDTVTEHPFMLDVQAAEPGNDNRILYKLKTSVSLETLTSGRTLYWKAYLRELNLFGHYYNANFWGTGHMPHNGFIALMYRYGIFAAVPYILMVIYNLIYAVKYFWKYIYDDKKYAFFILSDMLCCSFLLLVENLELPLGWVCWYGMYIMMGVYFDDEKEERVLEKSEKNYS